MQNNKETQVKTKRFFTSQTNTKLTSKYLVERNYLLSSVKKLLVVTDTDVILYPTNQFLERTDQIPFTDFQSIQTNDRDDKEFTIITKNNTYHTFSCLERSRLLTELYLYFMPYSKQDQENESGQVQFKFQERVIHQRDIYHEEESSKSAIFTIFNSLIEISYKMNQRGDDFMFSSKANMMSGVDLGSTISLRGGDTSKISSVENQLVILLIEIQSLRSLESTLYIMKHNMDIYKFVFPSQEKLTKAITTILMNAKAYMNYQVQYKKEDEKKAKKQLLEQKMPNESEFQTIEVEFLNQFYKTEKEQPVYIFETEGHLFQENDLPTIPVQIRLTEDYLMVFESLNSKIKIKSLAQLKDLKYVIVNQDSLLNADDVNLIFSQKNGFYQELSMKIQKTDQFLSATISLRNLVAPPKYSLQIFMHEPDFNQRIQGFKYEIDSEYETSIFRKAQDAMIDAREKNEVESAMEASIINQIIMNSSFVSMQRLPGLNMKIFAEQLIDADIKEYLEFEKKNCQDEEFYDSEESESDTEEDTRSDESGNNQEEQQDDNSYYSDEEQYQKQRKNDQVNFIETEKQSNGSTQISQPIHCLYGYLGYLCSYISKLEMQNKKLLLKGNFNIIKVLKKRLNKYRKLFEKNGLMKSLHLLSYTQILFTYLSKRKETTSVEDYKFIISEICSEQDDKKLLQIIDRLKMTEHFWFTLRNHIKYQILLDGVNVLLRIFKKSLFLQVETSAELFKNYNWDEYEWSQFFKIIHSGNLDKPEVQWNDGVKQELVQNLKEEVDRFMKEKLKHTYIMSDSFRELLHPVHYYDADHQIKSRVKNLKWNYNEFRVNFSVDRKMFRVWKYYLSRLLVENGEKPKIDLKIQKSKLMIFWDELQQQFMPSESVEEREIILKVMILLYSKNYHIIQEFRTLPYWLRLLRLKEYKRSHFLILQLIITILSVQNQEIAEINYESFIEADGLNIVFNCLNFTFKELKVNIVDVFDNDSENERIMHTQLQKKESTKNDNSTNINIGILSLKILDLIMRKDLNAQIYPLSKAKQFILLEDNVSILSQLLLIQNKDLTRETFSFIETHFSSQYCMYKFKSTGIVEFLIMYLDSELSKQAMSLLQLMQEVSFDYNDNLNLEMFYEGDDLKMIHQDHSGNLKNSIFLRYLPLPLVIKAIQPGNTNEFIQIFQEISYEKATLIWNRQMREMLKQQILMNSDQLISDLNEYAYNFRHNMQNDDHFLPKFNTPLIDIIKYKFIEEEVRCGQYYLRVWTQINWQDPDFFWIPLEEEDDFVKNLQASINDVIQLTQEQESEFQESQKNRLLILLKSNLLARETFKNNKTFCFDEIHRICTSIINNKGNLYQAQFILDIEYSPTIDKNADNLKMVNSKNGINLICDTIGYMLCNAGKGTKSQQDTQNIANFDDKTAIKQSEQSEQSIDLPMNLEERKKQIALQQSNQKGNNLDKIDQNISLMIDKTEAQTLQFCILSINKLIQEDIDAFIAMSQQFKVMPSRRNYQKRKPKSLQKTLIYQSNTSKKIMFQKQPSDNKLLSQNEQSYSNIVRSSSKQSVKRSKNIQIDFTGEQQKMIEREIAMKLVFELSSSILNLTMQISLNPALHPELIISGFAWKCLQQCYFALWQDEKRGLVHNFLKDAIATIQHLTSFSYVFTHQLQTNNSPFEQSNKFFQLTMQRFQNPERKDIIIDFWFDMKKLLEKKILDNLIIKFSFDQYTNKLAFDSLYDREIQKFIKIFSIEEKTHELIWNDQSREELLKILTNQLQNIDFSFHDYIQKFDYSVNINELRVEGIFVKQFNSDIYYKPSDVNLFVKSLLEQLKQRVENTHLTDLSDQLFDDVLEITKAIRNLIQYQNILSNKTFGFFKDSISMFCQLVKFKESDSVNEQRIITITSIIFDILKIFSKNLKFTEILNILNYDNLDSQLIMIKQGLLMFFLNTIFEKSLDKKIRIEIAKMIRYKIEVVYQVLGAYMPIYFFTLMEYQKNELPTSEDEMVNTFLNHLDSQYYENLFLRWNSDLKEQQLSKIKAECERILQSLSSFQGDFEHFDCNLINEPYQNPTVVHETIITNLIVRVFNKNPAVYIAEFTKGLCIQLDKQLFCLQEILNIFSKGDLEYEANNDDFVVQIRAEVFTIKQIRKKFKYCSQQTLQVMSAILLVLEQYLLNSYNPNKKRNRSELGADPEKRSQQAKSQEQAQKKDSLTSQSHLSLPQSQEQARSSIFKTKSQIQILNSKQVQNLNEDSSSIPQIYLELLAVWFDSSLLTSSNTPIELRMTFLQMIILTLDIPEILLAIGDYILEFTSRILHKIIDDVETKNIEDIMRLTIVDKMLAVGGREMILKFFTFNQYQNFESLKRIYCMNKKLVNIIEHIFIIMSQQEQCKQTFTQLSQTVSDDFIILNPFAQQDQEINWKDILKPRLDQIQMGQEFVNIWRNRPATESEARKYYSYNDVTVLEDKLEEQNVTKIKNLPYISTKAFKEIKKDDLMGESELNIHSLVEDLGLLELKEQLWLKNKVIDSKDNDASTQN
ncbi:UNKNOWN [Stylonychia lemnae]|uniref:Uncharacterized protein n=1 Tax=Stylonychia lemnae TaxID=5949 RepID=A0A078B4W3_STYLE|nr:UNKNOWN [Stylonychia lemnae]|eukprot:CDW89296.1 UNKNOWN [Stylonychia lemnae]